MLIKGTTLIGLPLISLDTGKEIEKVEDLIFDPHENKVVALLIDKGGWFSEAKVIPFEVIKSIGSDAIVVEEEGAVRKASEVNQKVESIAKDKTYLTKTRIMTEEGRDLGKITDIYFNDENGVVEEMEVSQGVMTNIKSGKKRVKVKDIVTIGEDAIIVKGVVEEEMEAQGQQGGLQGTVYEAKNMAQSPEVKEKADEMKDRAEGFFNKANQKVEEINRKINEGAGNLGEEVSEELTERSQAAGSAAVQARKDAAVGKYLTVNVLSAADEFVGRRGDLITHELIVKAESMGVLDKVINNVSDQPVNP